MTSVLPSRLMTHSRIRSKNSSWTTSKLLTWNLLNETNILNSIPTFSLTQGAQRQTPTVDRQPWHSCGSWVSLLCRRQILCSLPFSIRRLQLHLPLLPSYGISSCVSPFLQEQSPDLEARSQPTVQTRLQHRHWRSILSIDTHLGAQLRTQKSSHTCQSPHLWWQLSPLGEVRVRVLYCYQNTRSTLQQLRHQMSPYRLLAPRERQEHHPPSSRQRCSPSRAVDCPTWWIWHSSDSRPCPHWETFQFSHFRFWLYWSYWFN